MISQPAEIVAVSGQRRCTFDVFDGSGRYQSAETAEGKDGTANAADEPVPVQSDNRDTHPKGFASGCPAVIGKAIEGDINLVVAFERLVVRAAEHIFVAVGWNSRFTEDSVQPLPRKRIGVNVVLQQKFRSADHVENSCPHFHQALIDLGWIVEAAERHESVLFGRHRH